MRKTNLILQKLRARNVTMFIKSNRMITIPLLSFLFIAIALAGYSYSTRANNPSNTPKESMVTVTETFNESSSPNILLIIADDMGLDASPWYADYGEAKPKTPVLDRLAEDGLVFENVWSNPLCSPTRSTIITGKYGAHTGVLGALSKGDDGLSTSEYSLQKMITENSPASYDQAVIGKWHLATNNNGGDDNPGLMGVPYYSGYISGTMNDYSNWEKVTNGKTSSSTTYATTDFTNEAIDWIDDDEGNPWFLWLAYTAPHTPFHMPPEGLLSEDTVDNLPGSEGATKETPLPYYLASIEAMDTEVGRLLDDLSEKEKENTIIIFISDNGTPNQVIQSPFQKGNAKGSLYRGGVHVPMIVSGSGVATGRASELVNTSDLYTTIAELTGIELPQYGNSISFAPVLFDEERENNRDYLYADVSSPSINGGASVFNGWTVRAEGYQYISLDNGREKLFADSDLGQENNLVNSLPELVSRLKEIGEEVRGTTPSTEFGVLPSNSDEVVCTDLTDRFEDNDSDTGVSYNTSDAIEENQRNSTTKESS